MKPRHKRIALIATGLVAFAGAAALILSAFQSNLVFFFSPSQVYAHEAPANRSFRIGGLVEQGSLQRQPDGVTVRFVVTDTVHSIPVLYTGILPDLFREKQAVIATGRMQGGIFVADEVLAKHDETYMPKEVADKMGAAHQKHGVRADADAPAVGQ